jgi:hypothetical protein
MSIDTHLLALVARRFPAVYDVIPRAGQLVGTARIETPGVEVELNPQPIPPGFADLVALNPQPLPPRVLGALVAADLLQLSWSSGKLGQSVRPIADWEDDPCPTWPKTPKLPPHLGPPPPDPGPDWLVDYHLGLASTLAAAESSVRDSEVVQEALGRSVQALSEGLSR